jgi:cell wall-associated NlpC family hydrolase
MRHLGLPEEVRADLSPAIRHAIATRLSVAALVVAATLSLTATVAIADPIADAQAQAAKVQAQVDALNDKAEIAAEQYNRSAEKYSSLSAQAAQSARTLKKVTAQKNKLQSSLDSRATTIYRQGPLGFLAVLVNAKSFSDVDAAWQMMTNASRKTAITVDQLKEAKAKATSVNNRLVAQKTAAKEQKQQMAANKAAVLSQLGKKRVVLAQTTAEVRRLIDEKKRREAEEARRAAAAARAEQQRLARLAAARAASRRNSGGGSSDWADGDVPAGNKGEKAVAYAMKKIGCPYVWAADGPNTFDCSGLTMWAYRQVGVSLPHYSREQINYGKRVSRSNLQPGDLVFFGSPIHHVGMYVGGGKFIEAPYSGADVRVTSLSRRSDYAGACRPYL